MLKIFLLIGQGLLLRQKVILIFSIVFLFSFQLTFLFLIFSFKSFFFSFNLLNSLSKFFGFFFFEPLHIFSIKILILPLLIFKLLDFILTKFKLLLQKSKFFGKLSLHFNAGCFKCSKLILLSFKSFNIIILLILHIRLQIPDPCLFLLIASF